jgi:hypothetical protein
MDYVKEEQDNNLFRIAKQCDRYEEFFKKAEMLIYEYLGINDLDAAKDWAWEVWSERCTSGRVSPPSDRFAKTGKELKDQLK